MTKFFIWVERKLLLRAFDSETSVEMSLIYKTLSNKSTLNP